MKAKGNITHGVLFILLMLGMTLPFIQQHLTFVEVSPLKGAVETPSKAAFTLEGWFDGSYQEKEETYLNEAFGFRNTFVRINNQVAFSLFRKAKANGVIIGKKNYLYELNYIKAYYGDDFIGWDEAGSRIQKLKFIQDTLRKLDKTLLVVFAAGKGSFFPEYFPDSYQRPERGITNMQAHDSLAVQAGLNLINFNTWFTDNKEKSPYPLYPQYGIHWSFYGSCLAADSMISALEVIRETPLPHLYWDNIDRDQPRGTDYDIADGMNIKFRLKSYDMAYPKLQFQEDSTLVKPDVLVIADSYYWGMYNFGISRLFDKSDFWFYNKQAYSKDKRGSVPVADLNIKDEINDHDTFIILGTEATMADYGWGFIDRVYDYFTNQPSPVAESVSDSEIEQVMARIRHNDEWMEKIRKKAEARNIPEDSMVRLDAIWIIKNSR